MPGQQTETRNTDLGLGGGRHHRAVGIAHDDVAQSQRGTAILGALELRAADLDAMTSAQPLLDRRGQPGRDDVDGERTAAEPPPQGPGGNSN